MKKRNKTDGEPKPITDRQLRRLSKLELLDILIAQDRELEALRARNDELEKHLRLCREIFEKYMRTKPKQPSPGENPVQTDAGGAPVQGEAG